VLLVFIQEFRINRRHIEKEKYGEARAATSMGLIGQSSIQYKFITEQVLHPSNVWTLIDKSRADYPKVHGAILF